MSLGCDVFGTWHSRATGVTQKKKKSLTKTAEAKSYIVLHCKSIYVVVLVLLKFSVRSSTATDGGKKKSYVWSLDGFKFF